MNPEKCTEEIKLHLGVKLKCDLKELAGMKGDEYATRFAHATWGNE